MKTSELKRAAALQAQLEAIDEMMAELEKRAGDEVMQLAACVVGGAEEGTMFGDVHMRVMDISTMLWRRRRDVVKALPRGERVKLVLPYPVSANRYWRTVVNKKTGRAMTFVSNEAEAYKTEVGLRARVAGWRTPIKGAVELRVTLVPKNGICMDLDNCLKVSIDALKGIVYADDAQVYRIVAERLAPDPRGARLEVDAVALELPTPLELPLAPRAEKPAERDTGGLPF